MAIDQVDNTENAGESLHSGWGKYNALITELKAAAFILKSAATNFTAAVLHKDLSGSDLHTPKAHKARHTDGSDDIQNATAAQKGLATVAQITKLDGIEANAKDDQNAAEVSIADAGGRYTGAEVETALQEIAGAGRTTETIKANADAIPSNEVIIKAWIQFNGTGTIAIQDSFNVTSITDDGTGNYTVTWDTDFANDDYAITMGAKSRESQVTSMSVGSFVCYTRDSDGTVADASLIFAIAIGDQ